jgi:hypothetical protein
MAVLLSAAGCQTAATGPVAEQSGKTEDLGPPPTLPPKGLAVAPDQRFPDVPIPVDLKPMPERTMVFETQDVAMGQMAYTTRASVNELAQFYIDEAPAADWRMVSVIQDEGAELTFRKPGKRLEVIIRDLGITRGRSLIVRLMPESE